MTSRKFFLIGLIGTVLAVGVVSIAVASTELAPFGTDQQAATNGNIGVQQTARITSVSYVIDQGVVRRLDLSEPAIDIAHGHLLFIIAKGRCTGPIAQKGTIFMGDETESNIKSAALVKPGKTKTITTNPPIRYSDSDIGLHHIVVGIVSPDGTTNGLSIPVTVA